MNSQDKINSIITNGNVIPVVFHAFVCIILYMCLSLVLQSSKLFSMVRSLYTACPDAAKPLYPLVFVDARVEPGKGLDCGDSGGNMSQCWPGHYF